MTHPSHQTNGASLEDCHTNFFALTDLCGIKWRKLLYTETVPYATSSEPLDDPVLSSFSKCLAADILCVWRRVQAPRPPPPPMPGGANFLMDPMQAAALGGGYQQQRPPTMMPPAAAPPPANTDPNATLSLHSSKELWIFWYGEEPELTNLVALDQLVSDCEQGTWESGLSYECRSLLFKALHNLIERCLLSHDFVRLGKWFVQAYDGNEKIIGKSNHLSISFQFFVHGESTVCVSVDVRQHPPVRSLSRQYILAAQASASGSQVILAPFGLSGILTGQTYKASDGYTRKLIEEWRQFYPINSKYMNREAGDGPPLPPAVEVIVGGVKMRYPTCFVLATDMDDPTLIAAAAQASNLNGVQLSAVGGAIIRGAAPGVVPSPQREAPPRPMNGLQAGPGPALQLQADPAIALTNPGRRRLDLSERVWQDDSLVHSRLAPSLSAASSETLPPPAATTSPPELEPAVHWDFENPSKKVACSCSKCKKSKHSNLHKSGGLNSSSSSLKVKGEKSEKSRWWRSGFSSITPFHRRSPQFGDNDWLAEHEPTPATRATGPTTPAGGPPSYKGNQVSTPGMQQGSSDLPIPSVGSPPSAAPSPLINPPSQPASVTATDPAMPTLSPHPPSSNQPNGAQPNTPLESQDKVTPAATPDMNGPKSVSSISNQVFSPYPTNSSVEPSKPVDSMGPASASSATAHTPAMPQASATGFSFLKRPILASKDYESILQEEEQPSELLYDYSTMTAWLDHPVKRFKPCEKLQEKARTFADNFTPATQTGLPNPVAGGQPVEVKQEAAMGVKGLSVCLKDNSFIGDPYEFDEETGSLLECFKRSNKDDEKKAGGAQYDGSAADTKVPDDLFTSRGLQASYRDLDQIFDNSDDTSSDETHQVPTPPGSNKPHGEEHSITLVKPPRGSGGSTGAGGTLGCGAGILRAEELSKMFPTPPSLEHNPIASPSPCGQPDVTMVEPCIKQEFYPNIGSPAEENIEDWSFVFKPLTMYKMVGSSKYAPLTNLPSQLLPPVTPPPKYKPSWQYPVQMQEKSNQSQPHIPSGPLQGAGPMPIPHRPPSRPLSGISPISPAAAMRSPMGPYGRPEMSPMGLAPGAMHPHHRPALPPPYELASPASNASSYMNKTAVEPGPLSAAVIAARAPEANSLVVNILLADSTLHVFRDHNFDSCTLCVCNAGPRVVGNIRGADMYLHGGGINSSSSDEDQIRCNCGFSAVVNRRLSHRAGLFYEDEVEITGPLYVDENIDRKRTSLGVVSSGKRKGNELEGPGDSNNNSSNPSSATSSSRPTPAEQNNSAVDVVPQSVLELIRDQCVIIKSTVNALVKTSVRNCKSSDSLLWTLNKLEYSDGNDVSLIALDQGRQSIEMMHACKMSSEDFRLRGGNAPLHRWQFLRAGGPNCNQDIIRVMRQLQPLLQDAVQKKCTTRLWEAPYTVSGPLTWRQFHRLARGADDRCEPQPIPSILAGRDKDWVSLSPYALHYWENLLLEPFSYTRDVAYIVVAPDSEYILSNVRSFFRELSAIYELCRLGRHCPITRVLRDGILRVGKTAATRLAQESVDEWFTTLSDSHTTSMLKLYAQACRHHLVPHLSSIIMDKSLLNDSSQPKAGIERPTPSPMPPPTTPEGANQGSSADRQPSTPKTEHDGDGNHRDGLGGSFDTHIDDEEREPPAIVIYLVDPFSFGSEIEETDRLACHGLLRCYVDILNLVPEHIRANLNVQIVSLESILELTKAKNEKHIDIIRAQALSVFSQCRRLMSHVSNVKSLTGFGPAANSDLFLKSKDEKNRAPYRLYTPPYVLGKIKDKTESEGQQAKTAVMYCNYCLSEDQRFLLAACTDDRGEIFETVCINIEIPNRTRRKKASARRIGLQKLMDFILGIMSRTVQPWRLVVGRIGRLGHGELKGWSWLLGRKSLAKASKHLKEICNQCNLQYPNEVPCILSACLVSMEPDSCLRVMPDQFTPDERFSQASVKCNLSTPQDVSATHILVFPTSATSQSSQTAFQEQHYNDELGDEELLNAINADMDDIGGDLHDLFSVWPEPGPVQSPTGSPRRDSVSQPGSPGGLGGTGQQSPYPCNTNSMSSGSLGMDVQEEVGPVLQQPLALGYFVSTAKTGKMPQWFWASCPHLEDMNPAFLKNALHLHTASIQNSDDLLQQQSQITVHPLDSCLTTDVLRYVLEGYNALSWLALDHDTKDRLSCLPVHVQVLMQLYHTYSALV